MPRKKYTHEEIVANLRQIDVPVSQARPTADLALTAIGVALPPSVRDAAVC
jgi:hypothetical protein